MNVSGRRNHNILLQNFSVSYQPHRNGFLISFWYDGFVCYADITNAVGYLPHMWGLLARGTSEIGYPERNRRHPFQSEYYKYIYEEFLNYQNSSIIGAPPSDALRSNTFRFWYPSDFVRIYIVAGPISDLGDTPGSSVYPNAAADAAGIYMIKAHALMSSQGNSSYTDVGWNLQFPFNTYIAMSRLDEFNEVAAERLQLFDTYQPKQKPTITYRSDSATSILQFLSITDKVSHMPCLVDMNQRPTSYPRTFEDRMVSPDGTEIDI